MRFASSKFRSQLSRNPTFTQTVEATIPGEGILPLDLVQPVAVESSAGSGPRSNVNGLEVVSSIVRARELFGLLSRPSTTFDVGIGQRVSSINVETIPVFHGYAQAGSTRFVESAVRLDLVDPWAWIEGVPFDEPFEITGSTRSSVIAAIVTAVLPGVSVVESATGGVVGLTGVAFTSTRTQVIRDLAIEGQLDVYFDSSGRLIIRQAPEVASSLAVAEFKTGDYGTIVAGSGTRSRDFGRIYNAVRIVPDNPQATWEAVTVRLSDTEDPAHYSKIGHRPFEFRASSIAEASDAENAAFVLLQRLRKGVETAEVTIVADPLLEVGDPVDIITLPTSTDPGFGKTCLLTSMSIDLRSGKSTARAVDSSLYETEVA